METVQSGAQKDNVSRGGITRNKSNPKATEICYAEGDREGESGNGARPAAPELRRRGEGRAARDVQEKAEGAGPPPPAPPPVRSSSRVPKRPRWDAPPAPSPPKKPTKGDSKAATANGTPEAKTRRQWELWSSTDKDLFFEALNEHGKDFEAIQSVIAQRHRKRGNNQSIIRTKEQIRHFYYRTWHKIAKHIGIKKDVGKHTMELYGLVNYGEFRKRIGGNLNEKSGLKLNELIQKGATVVKTKGKNFRIRTPVCRALKKLNNIEETKDDEQVVIPKQLTLELRPVSNAAWATVQAISHNPRLRIHLPSNKRLSAVVDFLNKKWKSHRLRIKESMKAEEEKTKELVLTPPANCELYPFDVTPISSAPSVNLALEKFKDSSKDGKNDGTRSPAAKRVKRNTVSEEHHSENSAQSVEDVATQGDAVTATETDHTEQASTSDPKKVPVASALPTAATSGTNTQPEVSAEKPVVDDPESGKDAEGMANVESENKKAKEKALRKERIEQLQKGWNLKAAQGITIAELYLLLGCPEKLMLEYDWVDLVKNDNVMQMNLALTNMLRRLVQLATTEFSDFSKSKPPMNVESSPPKVCNCGGQMMTPPGRNAKNCRAGGGSTPKGGVKPGTPAVSKTSTGTQVPEENGEGVRGNTPVLASGSAGDGVFRVPNPVPVRPQPPVVRITPGSLAERHFLQQIELHKKNQHHDILMPKKPKKQVMRNIRRQPLVVQRTLLPKTGVPTRQIMTFTMMPNQSQMAQTGSFLPVVPGQTAGQAQAPVTTTTSDVPTPAPVTVASPAQLSLSGLTVVGRSVGGQQSLLAQAASAAGITPTETDMAAPSESQADSTSPNLSAILDISLPSVESNDGATNDSTFLSSIGNSSFSGLLDTAMPGRVTVDVNEDSMSLPASASSPNKSFKLSSSLGPDSQWMNGDDFSLSQFLSDSPLKRSSNDPTLVSECSRESIRLDVDTALQSMMNENSMEYSSKFADLAAQIAANAPDIVSSRLRKT